MRPSTSDSVFLVARRVHIDKIHPPFIDRAKDVQSK